jgi:hypothetical protein
MFLIQKEESDILPISSDEFNKYYNSFQNECFRLEALDRYQVSSDDIMYPQYLNGKAIPTHDDPGWTNWFSKIKENVVRGKNHLRVHIVPSVLNDYLRFEIEWGYALFNAPSGEKVSLFIKNDKIPPQLLNDFYLFDNRILIYVRYNTDNSWKGYEIEENPRVVQIFAHNKDVLLKNAIPLDEFLKMMRKGSLHL